MQRTANVFPGVDANALAGVLREFAVGQRWFRSKARNVRGARLRDAIPITGADCTLVLLDIEYEEGDADTYAFTLCLARGEQADTRRGEIGAVDAVDGSRPVLCEALWDRKFTDALLNAIAEQRDFDGAHGRVTTCHTAAFQRIVGTIHPNLPARVSSAEQSNTSVFYGDRFILKLYRKLDAGINPDFEIGRFLTERGFEHTPAVAGHIEYRPGDGAPMSVCILQQFVPNGGDAWDYTLKEAAAFFHRAGDGAPPTLPTEHPMELMAHEPPADAARLIGDYLESARRLGERTAQLHIALSAGGAGPDFEPEPFTDEFRDSLHKSLEKQADTTIAVLRSKRGDLAGTAARDAERLFELEPGIRAHFREVCQNQIRAVRIRHHGDFHLGQVLYTGDDFVIIDFEGEPARPLEERRMKHAAMRDVAGMIRSFQYAAYSALRKRDSKSGNGERQAAFWTAWVSRGFMKAYFDLAHGHAFLPEDPHDRKLLFDVFLLEKALYEVAYELNNRPDWVGIPLRGIAAIME